MDMILDVFEGYEVPPSLLEDISNDPDDDII